MITMALVGSGVPMLDLDYTDFVAKLQFAAHTKSKAEDIELMAQFMISNNFSKPSMPRGTDESDEFVRRVR